MTDDKKLKNAKAVYNSLSEILDEIEWKHDKRPDDLVIHFVARGDDLPMEFIIYIDVERELIRLVSPMPFTFPASRRIEGAIATCHANFKMADGCFEYDIESGKVMFKMTASYRDSLISKELFIYLVQCGCFTVDKYNDKFFMIANGALSVEAFTGDDDD